MGDAPTPPSAQSMQQAQIGANAATIGQTMGTENWTNMFGGQQAKQNPDGSWNVNQQYSPEEQRLLSFLQGTQQTAGGAAGNVLASGNYGAGVPNFADTSAGPTADLVGKATNAIVPQASFAIDQQSNQLQNMGLPVGSEAYNRGMEPLFQGLGSALSGFEAQFEPTAYNQAVTQFGMPLQLATGLAQLGAPTPLAGTGPTSPLVNAPSFNMMQAMQNQYQNQANQYGGMLSGIGGLMSGVGNMGTGGGSTVGGDLMGALFGLL